MIKEKKEKDTQKESYVWIIPLVIVGLLFIVIFIFIIYYSFNNRFSNNGKIQMKTIYNSNYGPEEFGLGIEEDYKYEDFINDPKKFNRLTFDKDDFFIKGEDGRPQRIHPRKAEELGLSENNMLRMKRKIQGHRR
jgi:hypothetical protein